MQEQTYFSTSKMFMKNYAFLLVLSISFLNFGLRVHGLVVSKEPHSEDGSEDIKISSVVKTIKTKYGDIIDCSDIHAQPAFRHPMLKNHKIQQTPNFPKGWPGSSSIAQVTSLKHLGFHDECPLGTVPIRRNINTKTSALQLETSPIKALSDTNQTERLQMAAILRITRRDTRYVAARARMDTQNPKCKVGEMSAAYIMFIDGDNEHFDMIVAGWAVNPTLFGDGNTRLSTFWANKIKNTGCYDSLCPGFVQVDRVVYVGSVLPNISSPGGPKYLITINVFQDEKTKNWWLTFGESNTPIGYWPKEMFSHIENASSRLDFGGFVEGFSGQPKPAMGSGVLPDGTSNYSYVSYFSQVNYIGQDSVIRRPTKQDTKIFLDDSTSYGIEFHSFVPGQGANFLYGGPNNSLNIVKPQSDFVRDM